MTVNQFMHRVKYDIILSSLDIPLTVNGKEVIDIEFVFGEYNEDGSYKNICHICLQKAVFCVIYFALKPRHIYL